MGTVLQFRRPEPPRPRPVSVVVHFSESPDLFDGGRSVFDFEEFERRTFDVAMAQSRGCAKTEVSVRMSDGNMYRCRLDLAPDQCIGFAHHIKALIATGGRYLKPEIADYAKSIDFGTDGLAAMEQAAAEFVAAKEAKEASYRLAEQEKAKADRQAKRALEISQQTAVAAIAPPWAKAAIVADFEHDRSDSQSDYYGHVTSRTVLLGFSRHTRDLFPEMRKAATRHPEIGPLVAAMDEHREKWSMGGGYYLKDGGRHSDGWKIRKQSFYGRPCFVSAEIPDYLMIEYKGGE